MDKITQTNLNHLIVAVIKSYTLPPKGGLFVSLISLAIDGDEVDMWS